MRGGRKESMFRRNRPSSFLRSSPGCPRLPGHLPSFSEHSLRSHLGAWGWSLYEFVGAAVTNDHKLGWLKTTNSSSHSTRGFKSEAVRLRLSAAPCCLEASREEPFLASSSFSWLAVLLGVSRPVAASLQSSHGCLSSVSLLFL